ncbi:hypothetical protein NHQ30_009715 [Ciborinia camelliae]|nr:hypothetical protein NHQ30_009715 [Ciborinia camelliae]
MPSSSSSFSIPNIGTANLTAIVATSSLYAYLIALHHHQQKTLLKDQELREQQEQERERARSLQLQKARVDSRHNSQREGYAEDQVGIGSGRSKRYPEDLHQRQERYPEDQRRYPSTTSTNTSRTARGKMSKTFSPSEVAAHKDAENGMYLIIDENVYDVTSISSSPPDFLEEHPGGAKILKRVAGKDASKQFWKYHNESVLKKYGEKLKIGGVGEKAKL